MATSSFHKNALIRYDGCLFRLRRMVGDALWQIEDEQSGRIREILRADLEIAYAKGALTFAREGARAGGPPPPLPKILRPDADPADVEKAKVKRAYVHAVVDLPMTKKVIVQAIEEVREKVGEAILTRPSFSSVYTWVKRYIRSGRDLSSLMDQSDAKGNRTSRVHDDLRRIIVEAVDTVFMVRERGTIRATLDAAQAAVIGENKLRPESLALPMPTRTMVRREVRSRSAFDRHAARHGHMAALRKFRTVLGKTMPTKPLDRAEIDHTRMDIFVIDGAGNPLGRPWLTVCIDTFTRCVLGICLGFDPPSHLTVARCLKHALVPKADLRTKYPAIRSEWPSHGVMRTLVVDNGLEFHSSALEAACYSLGIEIQYTPRKTPWYKGTIERFLGTVNRAIAHSTPGTTFSDIFEKDDYDPAKHAIVTLAVLEEGIHRWVADIYHQMPHRSLQTSPSAFWAASIRAEEIELPDDPAQLDAALGRIEFRTATHKGIELEGLFYNSTDLRDLRLQHGDTLRLELRVDDGDIGHVVALSPDKKHMLRVPVAANAKNYAPGMSAWQHKVCKRYAAEKIPKAGSPEVWLEAKAALRELFASGARKRTTQGGRRRVAEAVAPKTAVEAPTPRVPEAAPAPLVHKPGLSRRPTFQAVLEDRTPDNQATPQEAA